MKKVLKNIIFSLYFVLTTFILVSIYPNDILACCNNAQCGGGQQCIDAPANCGQPGAGSGYCVSGYETCSGSPNSSSCNSSRGECCGANNLCTTNCGGGPTPPPGGGGGAYQYPTCGGGQELKCGNDPPLYLEGSGVSPSAGCQTHRITCGGLFPSKHFECDDGGPGYCQTNCGCCAPSDNYTKSTTLGSTYTRINDCRRPTQCNDWDDYAIGHVAAPATDANRCYLACNNCGDDEEETFWVYNVITTCRSVTTTWNCVPSCNSTSPSSPSLSSPSNGAVVSTTTNNLTWSLVGQTWGTGCPSNINNYYLYVGPTSGSLVLVGSVTQASGSSSIPVTRSAGTYYWQVRASNGSSTANSPIWSFTISGAEPWWQVKDGDVTSNGNISSTIPDGAVFSDVGTGNYPGVPIYSGSLSMASTPLKISNPQRWNSNTQSSTSRTFNYQYFSDLVPSDVVFKNINQLESSGNSYHDYEWYKVTGNHTISSSINFGNRKVLIFVEDGNLTIDGNLTLDDGLGFLTVFVGGNINIGSSLPSLSGPELEGLYLANGTFTTGESNTQLHLRGSVVALQGFNLQRNLDNNIAAAEIFEYAADQVLLFPEKLAFRQTRWLEVNP